MVQDKDVLTSYYFFKAFFTGLVLAPALGIAAGITGSGEIGSLALTVLTLAGIALVIGIILAIWGN